MKIKKFAEGTQVSVRDTKSHIEHELQKYGITEVLVGFAQGKAMVTFAFKQEEPKFERTIRLWFLAPEQGYTESDSAHDRELRRLWRCLFLTLKAKLESYHSGIESFDEAFLPHIVTPSGTVGDQIIPKMQNLIAGEDVPLIPYQETP